MQELQTTTERFSAIDSIKGGQVCC